MGIIIRRVRGDEAVQTLTRRGLATETALNPSMLERNREIFGEPLSPDQVVDRILRDVRNGGDAAVQRYTELLDGVATAVTEVTRDQLEAALSRLDPALVDALRVAADRIQSFHERQRRQSWIETEELGTFGQIIRPLDRIGVYAPGGTAPLPSSLLMVAIPAKVAGVREVVLCTPAKGAAGIPDVMLAAASIAGVDRVFGIGGAQAIAAMAYGTETVPAVDKIHGPGGIFVALAKQKVSGRVAIDQIAGPTETMIIADDSADPELVAADLIAQAEHDVVATAVLVTTAESLLDRVTAEIDQQIRSLPRRDIIERSLEDNGIFAIVPSLDDAMECANAFAPEHLCLLTEQPWDLVPKVRNGAGIFVGESSPEALGDYSAGPSHVMPTGGTARYSSPVNLNDFQKVISLAAANPEGIDALGAATMALARAEGLEGHAQAIERRLRRT